MENTKILVMMHTLDKHGTISNDKNKVLRVWEFIKTCDVGDLALIMNTKAMNPILMDYLFVALSQLIKEDHLMQHQAFEIFDKMKTLLYDKTVMDVYKLKKSIAN